MSTKTFPHLMATGRIGPMGTPNRIVLPAMDMNVSEHGEIEQTEIDHYVARAKGGAGTDHHRSLRHCVPVRRGVDEGTSSQMTGTSPKPSPTRSTQQAASSASSPRTTAR